MTTLKAIPVYLETPYANGGTADDATIARNIRYLRACMHDCLMRGEAPFASHGLYTQPGVLRDELPEERRHGIDAGFTYRTLCQYTVTYTDLAAGVGVVEGIKHADAAGHSIERRTLGSNWEKEYEERVANSRSQKIWSAT